MEFEHIDDYNELLMPKKEHKIGADFKDLVTRYFDYEKDEHGVLRWTGSDLILCLFEMVTLKDNKNALGETLLRSHFERPDAETFIKTYRKIVDEVKTDKDCIDAISKYRDWYKKGTFILITSNSQGINEQFPNDSNWESQPPHTREDPDKNRDTYGYLSEEIFDQDIKKYLTVYYNKLRTDLKFKIYPHVCIIVKPIAVSYGSNIIPLGNCYLHFATRKERSRKFYLKFINDFIRVWYKEKGYESIRKIEGVAVAKALSINKNKDSNYLPNFKDSHRESRLYIKNLKEDMSISEYYNLLYSNDSEKNDFETSLFSVAENIIPIYKKIHSCIENDSDTALLFSEIGTFYTRAKINKLKDEYNFKWFKNALIHREVFKMGVLLFKIDPRDLHYRLAHKRKTKKELDIITVGTLKFALWTEHLIPSSSRKGYNKELNINLIQDSLGPEEKRYLGIYETIKKRLD